MSDRNQSSPVATGQVLKMLHELGTVAAPASLLPGTLARAGLQDSYWQQVSPIGLVYVAYGAGGVSAVRRVETPESFEAWYHTRFGRPVTQTAHPPRALAAVVERRLRADAPEEIEIDLRGVSAFQRAVLQKTLEIPRGEVRPYGWIAREIGLPGAVRAVGTALNHNPVPLLIPCHRVVQTSGRVGKYAFGSAAKRAALAAEGAEPDLLEDLAQRGVRYLGDTEDHTFCLPTCSGLHRRMSEPRYVPFRTPAQAVSAGYRACDVCRPALAG
ncbi:MAG: methylated-DNA--[protein]-cysteine S-methyltransferase [Chloroflexota bacterium]|nr:methylated-DNA--[protein]-cysteine S-methyltransferase [Chloroflexota bacterium]